MVTLGGTAFSLVVLSFLLSKVMLKTAKEIDLLDKANERSSHQGEVPKGGGLVFTALFSLFLLGLYVLNINYRPLIAPILIASPALFGLGWIDDRLRLSATKRLIFHLGVALVVFYSLTKGLSDFFTLLFFPDLMWLNAIFVILYIIWFINLYNFMDGGDGLAGTSGLFGALALSLISHKAHAPMLSFLYLGLGASLVGFVFYNWNPAKFFMGDSGAYFLGGTFAVMSLVGKVYGGVSLYPTIILFGALIVDATYTLIIRVAKGNNPYVPHNQFGFHKLFQRGWPHNQVTKLYCFTQILWLMPLAYASVLFPAWSFLVLVVAYLPLLAFEVYIKAGRG